MRMSPRAWPLPFVLSCAASFRVGISAGVGGVLLLAQIRDYDVDMATIGLTSCTFSAGFFLAGTGTGALLGRLGTRAALLVGSGGYLVAVLITAARPSFVVLVPVQVLAGYGIGVLESVLTVYLSGLPSATVLLNRLHAFFGFAVVLPRHREPAPRAVMRSSPRDGLLAQVLRRPAVMLAAAFLAPSVGLEVNLGNWAFTDLVQDQG